MDLLSVLKRVRFLTPQLWNPVLGLIRGMVEKKLHILIPILFTVKKIKTLRFALELGSKFQRKPSLTVQLALAQFY